MAAQVKLHSQRSCISCLPSTTVQARAITTSDLKARVALICNQGASHIVCAVSAVCELLCSRFLRMDTALANRTHGQMPSAAAKFSCQAQACLPRPPDNSLDHFQATQTHLSSFPGAAATRSWSSICQAAAPNQSAVPLLPRTLLMMQWDASSRQ